jgi:hypothetical protein
MLVNKGYSVGDCVSFKIANGDEVVGRIEGETETEYLIAHPMTVVPSANGLGLMQSMFSTEAKGTAKLSKAHIMMHNRTMDAMADHYRETTTGIKTVRNESRIIV